MKMPATADTTFTAKHVAASPRTVRCPACRGSSLYGPANPFRPFCSERCKQLDLGAWAAEQFSVPAQANLDGQDVTAS